MSDVIKYYLFTPTFIATIFVPGKTNNLFSKAGWFWGNWMVFESEIGYLEPHKMVLYYKNPDIGITFEGETQYFEDSSGNYERIEKRIRF